MHKISRLTISGLAVAVTLTMYVLLQLTPLGIAENMYEDLLVLSAKPDLEVSDNIVVLEIRESTLAKFPYRSPLDRGFLADLINKLVDAEAKSIGIDVILDQPTSADKDEALKNALLRGGASVFVPVVTEAGGLSKSQLAYQDSFLKGLQVASIVLAKDRLDGVVRHYLAEEFADGQRRKQLASAMADEPLENTAGQYHRISFYKSAEGEPVAFKTYPAEAAAVLPDEWFRGKYILIGKNIANVDQFRTPFNGQSGNLPGVQVHAHILNQLLAGSKVAEYSWPIKLLTMLAASFAGVLLVLRRGEIWLRFALVAVVAALLLTTGYLVYLEWNQLLPMLAATLVLLASCIVMTGVIWNRDRSERIFIRQAWSHYVSEDVVDSLIADPVSLKPGGSKREATFIFTDIEGFTRLSEKLPPDTLSDVINDYLDLMTAEFQKSNVTLDKFVGDAIVGFVGAPVENPDHPDVAVSLALKLEEKSRKFRDAMQAKDITIGKTRIGINTGSAVIGNFGGSNFFDYTALGDAVNVAARLEGANKMFGSSICVSGETVKRAKRHSFRPVGRLYVEGKRVLVEAWEPVAVSSDLTSGLDEYLAAYEKLENGVKSSLQEFQKLNRKFPADPLVKFHLRRLEDGQSGVEIEVGK